MMNLFKRRFSFATLVLAEHNGLSLSKNTLKILSASFKLNDQTHLLLKGNTSPELIEQVKNVSGNQITKIITTQSTEIAEDLGYLIKKLISSSGYKNVVGATTSLGKDIIPRVAGYFSSQPITDIIEISAPNTYIRPTYAGNAMTKVTTSQQINFLTFRPSSFQEPSQSVGNPSIEEVNHSETVKTSIVSQESSDSSKPELTTARIVVSGGRGVKSKENFSLINQLADAFGQAAVGASRAAVDAGYCPNDLQVGQTGKVVAPELYIAVGISGAVQHLAGMKDSKVIVAINTKPDEPIFELANYGLEADLFKAVPELTAKIRKLKGL